MPAPYKNVANHIRIPGLTEQAGLAPGSPTDIQLSVPIISLTTVDGRRDDMSPPPNNGNVLAPPEAAVVALPPAALDGDDWGNDAGRVLLLSGPLKPSKE